MINSRALVLSLVVCLVATAAAAQQPGAPVQKPPDDPRLFFSLNGLGQTGSQTLQRTVTFPLYEEEGGYGITQRVEGGAAIDVGGAYRVWRYLGVGLGFTRSSHTGSARIEGTVPHPLFFNRPRSFSLEAGGLRHRERAVHLQAIWFMPVTNEFDVKLFIGPSFLHASLNQVSDVRFSEVGAPFTSIDAFVTAIDRRSASSVGINVGVDATYTLLRNIRYVGDIGAGVMLRYAGGSVDLPRAGGGEQSLDVGGFQAGGGLRVRLPYLR